MTAGIDLALSLVEDDHGTEIAQTVARWLVLYLRRPGGRKAGHLGVGHRGGPVVEGVGRADPCVVPGTGIKVLGSSQAE